MMIRVMGIDPGSNCTGYGVLAEEAGRFSVIASGAIFTPPKDPIPQRLERIYTRLLQLMRTLSPQVIVIEDIFFAKNVKSALHLGQARGVAILAAARRKLPVYEYSPLEIKQAVVGYGRAPKSQVQAMVKELLGLKALPEPNDVADALAVAICHLHSIRFKEKVAP